MRYTKPPWELKTLVTTHVVSGKIHELESNLALMSKAPEMYEALKEIAEGKGRYDMDQFQHAKNTIEDMKEIATALLKEIDNR